MRALKSPRDYPLARALERVILTPYAFFLSFYLRTSFMCKSFHNFSHPLSLVVKSSCSFSFSFIYALFGIEQELTVSLTNEDDFSEGVNILSSFSSTARCIDALLELTVSDCYASNEEVKYNVSMIIKYQIYRLIFNDTWKIALYIYFEIVILFDFYRFFI